MRFQFTFNSAENLHLIVVRIQFTFECRNLHFSIYIYAYSDESWNLQFHRIVGNKISIYTWW